RGLVKNEALSLLIKEGRLLIANLTPWRIGLLFFCGLLVSGIALSLSRGGMISLVVAVVLTVLFLIYTQSRRALVLVVVFLVPLSIASFVWASFQEEVFERIETLEQSDILEKEIRVRLWTDSLGAVNDYPVLGSGGGSYRYVYKEYQSFADFNWYFHAENIYLETLITYGFVGFAVMLGSLVLLCASVRSIAFSRQDDRSENSKNLVVAILGVFILVSQLVSNFFDFGLLIPSNGILFAVMMGSIVGVSSSNAKAMALSRSTRFGSLSQWTGIAVPLVLCVGAIWSGVAFCRFVRMESANQFARTNHPEEYSLEQVSQCIEKIESIVKSGDASLESYEYLAALYVLRFQHELVELRMENLPVSGQISRKTMWELTTPRMLNLQFSQMEESVRDRELKNLKSYGFYGENLVPAVQAFETALVTCPLSVRSLVGLAEISRFTGQPVEPYLETFREFNVQRASWLLRMGDVAIAHGLEQWATEFWRKSLKINPLNYKTIIPTAREMLAEKGSCLELSPENPEIIRSCAEDYFSEVADDREREILYKRIIRILDERSSAGAESRYQLGQAYMELGDINLAILNYENATALNPLNYQWKHELVTLYERVGKTDAAKRLIQECAAAEPNDRAIQAKYRALNGIQ
ncbi:MAG: O-antigen ligase family protein, partial [Planctomycetota bacterium]|nr:O-antigen ligase family protein [Planctomycetota bacterium]